MKKISVVLSHLSICFALALLTIMILDGRNPMMKFLTSNVSKTLIVIACAVFILSALVHIIRDNGKNN